MYVHVFMSEGYISMNLCVCVCVCVCVLVLMFTQYPVVRASKVLSVLSYSLVLLAFLRTGINDFLVIRDFNIDRNFLLHHFISYFLKSKY